MISLAFFGFRLFDVFIDSVLSVHNIRWKLSITEKISIDFYGALIPTIFSLLFAVYLIYFRELSVKQYLREIPLSVAFALIFSRVSSTAIITFYKLVALLVSFVAVFVTLYDGGLARFLKLREFNKLNFTRRNYVKAFILAYSYASLSVLVVDITYLPFATAAYIGAMGLTDGIMLTGLATSICVPIATLFIRFLYEMGYAQ